MKAKQKRAILFVILGGVLLCAGAVLAFALGLPTGEAPYPEHIIDGVSPNGTTINLFDYWITTQEDPDNEDPANLLTSGINNDHALLFGASLGGSYGDWNEWTGTAAPRTGIVENGLTNGYPQLAINTSAAQNETIRNRSGSESLAYLFDPAVAVDGKASYRDAQGLLQVDKDGYYYFNSAENYAVYYPGDNAFTLYEYPGVGSGGAAGNVGQFFPFNAATADAERYFYRPPQGADTSQQRYHTLMNTVYSTDASLNHYFGIHMSTRFVQQYGGHVDENKTKAVTYEFSGDDDVWIFIDGVLVADLGGIHNAASVKIDFSTGEIKINGAAQGQKLGALLGVGRNTLPDGTYHTLDFFYLERGNTDSNLSLKYNLVSIPESTVIKVDENGNTLAGAAFELTVSYTEDGESRTETLTSGATGADGRLVLRESEDPDALPLTIDQLYERYGQKKNLSLTLTETSTPDGYRSAGAVSLRFDKVGEQHILLAANPWSTGAYATSGVLLKLGNSIGLYSTDGGIMGDTPEKILTLSDATAKKMFGVIFMKDGDDWRPIHGNPIDGWKVEDGSDWKNIQAALTENPCWFQLGSGGAWEITIDELPGDITKYYNALPENERDSAQYGVFYYYTEADAVEKINGNNTWLMNTFAENSGVQRQFFANLYVPNLRNELSVLKVDDQDQPLAGAAFALYAVDDVTLTDGGYTAGGTARLAGVTGTNGLLVFGDDELLPQGNYYLIETSAPTGYLKNGTPIPVVVDDAGVHVDAGTEDNGVSVRFEAGNLVGSMWAFATDDEIDVTLHHITAKFYTTPSDAVEFDADTTFADQAWRGIVGEGANKAFQAIDGVTYRPSYYAVSDGAGGYTVYRYDENVPEGASPLGMHLKYAGNGRYDAYAGPEQQGDPVTFMETATGWGHLMMEQCSYHTLASGKEYTELHGAGLTDLTNLFADSVTVKVANEPVDDVGPEPSYIVVQKSIAGLDDAQIEKLKQSLAITVTGNGEAGPVSYTLAYGREDGVTILWREVNKTLWSWRINGVSGDTYTVTETGCEPEDLGLLEGTELTATGLGTTTIGVSEIGLEIEEATTCSHTDWPLYDGCFFAGTLTGNRGTVVITSRAPSASQRKAIKAALLHGVWKEPVYYYSLNSLQINQANQDPAYNIAMNISGDDGVLITTLHYYPNVAYADGGTPGKIVFADTSVWQHVAKIVYDTEAAQVGDIQISNTYTQLMDLAVEKVWDDADDQDGKRPETVTVRLLADGESTDRALTLNADNGWAWRFTDLPKYENGQEIVYTIAEDAVPGYTATVDGFTITNTHTPETTAVSVEKVWDDADDQDGMRPDEITVRLLADGQKTDRALTLNADNDWAGSFSDLAVYNAGQPIAYTVEEEAVTGYQPSITGDAATGFTITNTHTPETTAVSVEKVWDDADDQDGMRPDEITVRLLADGQKTDRALTLNADNDWAGSFSDLAVYNAGQPIAYTVEEEAVTGYQPSITGDAATGFTITNTHTPETITVSGSKTWDDADDRSGMRPKEITIRLLANGVEVAGKARTVTAADGWAWRFTDLPKYENGQEIVYTIAEDAVPGYTATVDGFNVTNTKDILPGSLTVSKTVSGNAGDTEREWAFTVWLDDTDINGAYGDMTFVGGMATFLLRHGESATATGLPAGVSYRVTETGANQDGYDTTKHGDKGVIPEGGTATATFDNAKTIAPPPTTGSLAVSKTVSGNAGDTEREWTFTVRLGDTSINGAYGDMTFVDGVATFRLRHGESVKATGLPAGVTYVVTEAEANQDGYATAATGNTGTISGGRTARAGFTNTRETPQVPAAGDEASPLLWFTLGCVCLLGLGGAAMLNRRMRGGTKS